MATRPPTALRILIAVGFALSCFGLALFLWIAFGGPVPLKPEGYRVTVPFTEAAQLAQESDVRISGVSVGKVKEIELGDGNEAEATLEIDDAYAPLPEDTEAILRQKTLLGETYVELTPGADATETIPEGGTLAASHVSDSVQLDEIFRTFDAPTRAAFQQWMQSQAVAVEGRGADLSAALGELDPFAQSARDTLRILDTQSQAIRQLVRDGGDVFTALSERRGQLRGLIQNTDTVFRTTAARNEDLAETFEVFPTFLRETRTTLDRLREFSEDTDPLVRQLRPAAQELGPTVADLGALSPSAQRFFVGLRGSIAARSGLPALRKLLRDDLPPLLTRLPDYLNELDPILTAVKPYRNELTAFLGNTSNAINSTNSVNEVTVNRLRTSVPLGPETLATFPSRLTTNRTNPYVKPGGYLDLDPSDVGNLLSFENRQCTGGGLTATIAQSDVVGDPAFDDRVTSLAPQDQFTTPQGFYDNLLLYALGDGDGGNATTAATPAPPCAPQQGNYESIGKVTPELSQFQHVYRQGTP